MASENLIKLIEAASEDDQFMDEIGSMVKELVDSYEIV